MPLPRNLFQISGLIMADFIFYSRSQFWDMKTLEAYQLKKLKKLLKHAGQHVPYYQALFARIGFDPEQMTSVKDLQRIPVITKQDILTEKEKFIAANHRAFHPLEKRTSGTTGTPLTFLLDRKTEIARLASILRCYSWAGYLPGRKVFSLQEGRSFESGGIEKSVLQRKIKTGAAALTRKNAVKLHRMLFQFKPDIYIVYPNALIHFIRLGIDNLRRIHTPKAVISGGENLNRTQREFIEGHLHCNVFDFYGNEESVVQGMQDKFGNKYLMEDFGIHEILDESSHKPVRPGESGMLVGTSLNNYSMPFIRYQIGDRIRTLDAATARKPTKSGIKLPRFSKLQGRKNDIVHTPDGRQISLVDNILHLDIQGIVCSQLVQEDLHTLTLKVVAGNGFDTGCFSRIKKEMASRIGKNMQYAFEIVDELESTAAGKIPFMVSKL